MKKLFLAALLLFPLIGFGQVDDVKFKRFTTDDGLSQNFVKSIFKDSYGYIWFGTSNSGLNKFDGHRFTVYKFNPKDTLTLSNSGIDAIGEDINKRLWVATPKGLNYYNRKLDRFIRVDATKDHVVNGFCFHSSGKIFFTTQGGFLQFDFEDGLKQITTTDDNNHNFGNFTGKLLLYDKNMIIAGTENGVFLYDIINSSFKKITSNNTENQHVEKLNVKALYKRENGSIWVGTYNNGLFLLEQNNKQFIYTKNFMHKPEDQYSLKKGAIVHITEDTENRLWVASENKGINIFELKNIDKPSPIFYFLVNEKENSNSLSENSVQSIYKDNEGIIWVGTFTQGINYYSPFLFKFKHIVENSSLQNTLRGKNVTAFAEDKNSLWVTTSSGLNKYNKRNQTWKLFSDNLSGALTTMFQDSKSRIWVGTWGGGLILFDQVTETTTSYLNDPEDSLSISSNNIFGITEDKEGIIWLATMGGRPKQV